MLSTATLAPGQLTDEQWVRHCQYAYVSAEEAAADPRTPEEYLVGVDFRSIDQLLFLLGRRPIGNELAARLIRLLHSPITGRTSGRRNEAIRAALQLPQVNQSDLLMFADETEFNRDDKDATLISLVRHPQSSERVAAQVLLRAHAGHGAGSVLEEAVGRSGFLAAAALRLLRLEDNVSLAIPMRSRRYVLDTAAELDLLIGDRPALRQVVSVLGPTWNGSRSDLIEVASGITQLS